MTKSKSWKLASASALALVLGTGVTWGVLAQPKNEGQCACQHGGPGGGPGYGRGGAQRVDMSTIHALFADPSIQRTVREIPGGVETLTESDTPEGALNIQKHVAAMHLRIKETRPIHVHDPLFAEIFRHADQIEMQIENTPKGVKVRETSRHPYVVGLIRAHADVVTKFIENGRREMHQNHEVPAAP